MSSRKLSNATVTQDGQAVRFDYLELKAREGVLAGARSSQVWKLTSSVTTRLLPPSFRRTIPRVALVVVLIALVLFFTRAAVDAALPSLAEDNRRFVSVGLLFVLCTLIFALFNWLENDWSLEISDEGWTIVVGTPSGASRLRLMGFMNAIRSYAIRNTGTVAK